MKRLVDAVFLLMASQALITVTSAVVDNKSVGVANSAWRQIDNGASYFVLARAFCGTNNLLPNWAGVFDVRINVRNSSANRGVRSRLGNI